MDNEILKAEIQAKYDQLGFNHGWELAKTPMRNLYISETIIFGLNPGGSSKDPDDIVLECKDGNDYFLNDYDGRWRSLQKQLRALHEIIDVNENDVFAAQFFPFRSENWGDMSLFQKEAGMQFSQQLWRSLITRSPAKRFICMGEKVTDAVAELLDIVDQDPETFATGWGSKTIKRYVASDGRILVYWPHPSRYQIFSRPDFPAKEAQAKEAMRSAARLI